MGRHSSAATGVLAAALASGCACQDLPWVELAGERFCVEIADDDAERTRGLMFRDRLPASHGMLFVFEHEAPQSFWMMNTRIPLDILYFDAGQRLVSGSLRTPPCASGVRCPGYPSTGPAKYVLELNAGTAERLGVVPGDELTFGPDIRY
ncbi:MAG TPA: DUF192 domain-containing protein [Xanthomonadaceae bacterium]|nr:DUF192 domain-containing protein [Xanthomonadaceae bacterium]